MVEVTVIQQLEDESAELAEKRVLKLYRPLFLTILVLMLK